jgi:hypothetical protein
MQKAAYKLVILKSLDKGLFYRWKNKYENVESFLFKTIYIYLNWNAKDQLDQKMQ